MRLYGTGGDSQSPANPLVAIPFREQLQHLDFAMGQCGMAQTVRDAASGSGTHVTCADADVVYAIDDFLTVALE